jgi:hypothetical protein
VELCTFDVLDEASGARASTVTDAPASDVLSCARHTAGNCVKRKEVRRSMRSHDEDLDESEVMFEVL